VRERKKLSPSRQLNRRNVMTWHLPAGLCVGFTQCIGVDKVAGSAPVTHTRENVKPRAFCVWAEVKNLVSMVIL
jgi:hypothetical protein